MKLIDALPIGRDNAITSKALAVAAGYKSIRDLQKAIRALRLMGVPVISIPGSPGGYFLSSDPAELERCSRTLSSRAKETLEIARIFGDKAADLTGQEQMGR